jgi:hypothetical protein
MSELQRLRESWEAAEARLHTHLPAHHHGHLSAEHRARVAELSPEIEDDILGDPGEVEDAVAQARSTYDAYLQGVRTLAAGGG